MNDVGKRTSLMKSTSVSARPEPTATLVRLMLSVNDIALAADANDQWAETGDRKRAAMRNAARGYFVRVLLSHVYEGLLDRRGNFSVGAFETPIYECDRHSRTRKPRVPRSKPCASAEAKAARERLNPLDEG